MDREEKFEYLKGMIAQLAEHFDTVQVFVSAHLGDDEGTQGMSWGSGNYYARKGQVQTWIQIQEAPDVSDS